MFTVHDTCSDSFWKDVRNGGLLDPNYCGERGVGRSLVFGNITSRGTPLNAGQMSSSGFNIVSRLVTTAPLALKDSFSATSDPVVGMTVQTVTEIPTTEIITIEDTDQRLLTLQENIFAMVITNYTFLASYTLYFDNAG